MESSLPLQWNHWRRKDHLHCIHHMCLSLCFSSRWNSFRWFFSKLLNTYTYTCGDSSCPGLRSRFQILNISGLIMPATFRGMPSETCGRMQRWRKFWGICMGTKTFHYLRSGSAISHHISSNHDSPAVGIANCSLNWDPFGNSSWTLGLQQTPEISDYGFFLKNSHCDHNRRQCRKHPSKWRKFPYEIYS